MMKIVIDTNVLLMILPKLSKYRLAFDALISGKYTLALSNEILSEYVEKLEEKTTVSIANNVAELLNVLPNVEKTEIYYNWSLITKDDDDNKFVDCAIAARVRFVVSNDKAFNILKTIDFPKVDVITIEQFVEELLRII